MRPRSILATAVRTLPDKTSSRFFPASYTCILWTTKAAQQLKPRAPLPLGLTACPFCPLLARNTSVGYRSDVNVSRLQCSRAMFVPPQPRTIPSGVSASAASLAAAALARRVAPERSPPSLPARCLSLRDWFLPPSDLPACVAFLPPLVLRETRVSLMGDGQQREQPPLHVAEAGPQGRVLRAPQRGDGPSLSKQSNGEESLHVDDEWRQWARARWETRARPRWDPRAIRDVLCGHGQVTRSSPHLRGAVGRQLAPRGRRAPREGGPSALHHDTLHHLAGCEAWRAEAEAKSGQEV
jgi:hypothetical protein